MRPTEIRHLPCNLTEAEVLQKAEAAAKCVHDVRKLEDEKAAKAKEYGSRIKDIQRDLRKLSTEIATRQEVRPVQCRRVPILAERKMAIVRTDTGELVEERPMTAAEIEAERQTTIFGMKEGPETRESRMLPPSTRDEDEDADAVH